jgi:hypothetical protein
MEALNGYAVDMLGEKYAFIVLWFFVLVLVYFILFVACNFALFKVYKIDNYNHRLNIANW